MRRNILMLIITLFGFFCVHTHSVSAETPKNEEADKLYFEALTAKNKQRYNEAIDLLNKAIDLNPNDPRLFLQLGRVYRIRCRYDKAKANYSEAIEIGGTNSFHGKEAVEGLVDIANFETGRVEDDTCKNIPLHLRK